MSISSERINLTEIEIEKFLNKIIKMEDFTIIKNKIVLDIQNYKVLGDSELLEVVIRNLVENANKAEPKDNKILKQIIRDNPAGQGQQRTPIILIRKKNIEL